MNKEKNLEKLYREYLQSHLDSQIATKLCQALRDCGLNHEAQGLMHYLSNGHSTCMFDEGLWKNRRCFVGPRQPLQAEWGNLWLDTTELTLAVLVPSRPGRSTDTAGWVSTHPVYVWQFRTFINLVEIGEKTDMYFPPPSDYLLPERFESMAGMDFITNIYHDEALAYIGWFDKGITDDSSLEAARDFLNLGEFLAVLPKDMKFWVGGEYSEWLRVAVGANSIDKRPYQDELKLEELNGDIELFENLPDRMLFDEWDKRNYIGLSTGELLLSLELPIDESESFTTLHFEILNKAPR